MGKIVAVEYRMTSGEGAHWTQLAPILQQIRVNLEQLHSRVINKNADLILVKTSHAVAEEAVTFCGDLRRLTNLPIFVIADWFSVDWLIDLHRRGVTDMIGEGSKVEEFREALERAGLLESETRAGVRTEPTLVGRSPKIRDLREYLQKIANSDASVLITGETGTGKEVVAELIHSQSKRRDAGFVAVNCAALPDSLMEDELFGHEKGAFTGADRGRNGMIQAADGGTLFLDEISEMSLFAQAKLLRVLEKRTTRRIGSEREIPVDCRVIAASNRDVERGVRENQFREDLFYRLNVARVELPPLRDRLEDIPLLIEHFRRSGGSDSSLPTLRLDDRLLERIFAYDWPGNVRELRNFIEVLAIAGGGFENVGQLTLGDLPLQWRDRLGRVTNRGELERSRLLGTLRSADWNRSEAARRLSWSRMTLYRKMRAYGITKEMSA